MSASAAASRLVAATRGPCALVGAIGALILMLTFAAVAMAQDQPTAPVVPAPATTPKEGQPLDASKMPENVEPLPSSEAASVLGKKVRGPNGEDLGLVVDVLVDPNGQPRAAVIDFGGFLGVGSRKVAVDWKALDFTSLGRAGAIELGLDRAQIAAAPEYKPGPPGAAVVTAPLAPAPPVDTHK
jgi:PRC-barrel domain